MTQFFDDDDGDEMFVLCDQTPYIQARVTGVPLLGLLMEVQPYYLSDGGSAYVKLDDVIDLYIKRFRSGHGSEHERDFIGDLVALRTMVSEMIAGRR